MDTKAIVKRLNHCIDRLNQADQAAESGQTQEAQMKMLVARNALAGLVGILEFEGDTKSSAA